MAGIKKILSALTICFIFTLLVSCTSSKVSPIDTAISLKESLALNDFNKFQALFSEGKRDTATKELFERLKEIDSSGAGFKSYTVIALDNGEMLLVYLTPNEEQAIQSITIIPEEHKVLFTE